MFIIFCHFIWFCLFLYGHYERDITWHVRNKLLENGRYGLFSRHPVVKSKACSVAFFIRENANVLFHSNRTLFQAQWAETPTRHAYITMWCIINNEYLFVLSKTEGTESETPCSSYRMIKESTFYRAILLRMQSITPAICLLPLHMIWEIDKY